MGSSVTQPGPLSAISFYPLRLFDLSDQFPKCIVEFEEFRKAQERKKKEELPLQAQANRE